MTSKTECHVEPGDRVRYHWRGLDWTDEAAEVIPESLPESRRVGPKFVVRMLSGRVVLPAERVCIVDPDRDGPTLWDCGCTECRRLARDLD